MKRRQPDARREFRERDGRGEIVGEAGFHRFDAHGVAAEPYDGRPLARVTCEQRRQRVEQRGFGGERIGAGFERAMRQRETPREIAVADDVGREPRQRLGASGDFACDRLHEFHRQIEHAIPPARIDRPRARMQLAGIDDRHRARLRDIVRAAIVVALRARFDHGHRVRVVPVRRERVVVIFGGQHVRAGRERRAPVACGIAESVDGHGKRGDFRRSSE